MASKTKTPKAPKAETAEKTVTRPKDLADELNVSAKALRGWLRSNFTRESGDKNTSWTLTDDMVKAAREHYTKSDKDEESDES